MEGITGGQPTAPKKSEEETIYQIEEIEHGLRSEAEVGLRKILNPRRMNLIIEDIEKALRAIKEYLDITGAPSPLDREFFDSVVKEKERLDKLLELRKNEKKEVIETRKRLDALLKK